MNSQETVKSRRTLHRNPTYEEFGIKPEKQASAGTRKFSDETWQSHIFRTDTVSDEQKIKEAHDRIWETAGNTAINQQALNRDERASLVSKKRTVSAAWNKKTAEIAAVNVISGMGGSKNIDAVRRIGNELELKAKDPEKIMPLQDWTICGYETVAAGSTGTVRVGLISRQAAYDVRRSLLKKCPFITGADWVWMLLTAAGICLLLHDICGIREPLPLIGAGIGGCFLVVFVSGLFHSYALLPALFVVGTVFLPGLYSGSSANGLPSDAGPEIVIYYCLIYWLLFWIIERIIQAAIRKMA